MRLDINSSIRPDISLKAKPSCTGSLEADTCPDTGISVKRLVLYLLPTGSEER